MKTFFKTSAAIGLSLLVATPVFADACRDVAAHLKTEKTHTAIQAWPGVEVEQPTYGVDYGSQPFKPVLQNQKARLLAEAKAVDPGHQDIWQAFLASSAAEQAKQSFESISVYDLKSVHMGRIEMMFGGTMYCGKVTYYRTDPDGQVHVVDTHGAVAVHDPNIEDGDDADICESGYREQLVRIENNSLDVVESVDNDIDRNLTISEWNGQAFERKCSVEASYAFSFSPVPNADAPKALFEGAYAAYLKDRADAWGYGYMISQAGAAKIAGRNEAGYGAQRLEAFVKQHPQLATEARQLADMAAKTGDYHNANADVGTDALAVIVDGRTYVVLVTQGSMGWRVLPNIVFDMFALQNGKAVRVASIDTERRLGQLVGVDIKR